MTSSEYPQIGDWRVKKVDGLYEPEVCGYNQAWRRAYGFFDGHSFFSYKKAVRVAKRTAKRLLRKEVRAILLLNERKAPPVVSGRVLLKGER